ncbi:SRPBCC family protein [Streptomyces sp. NPDC050145]|uniref:SRPBCC family protein n=1 Tax=Streptomyces sp. NPDC050145 TaxID=3365602 RepID=UPI0037A82AFC
MTGAAEAGEAPSARPRRKRLRRRILAVLATLLALLAVYTAWANARPYTLSSSIELDATPDEVWRALTDLSAYDEWNPFIVSADGTVERNATLRLVLRDETGDSTFTPTVLAAEPGRKLRWLGRIGPGLIFDGEHRFLIERLGEHRVRLTQSEEFRGVVVPFFRGSLDSRTLPQFGAMNRALADRVAELVETGVSRPAH